MKNILGIAYILVSVTLQSASVERAYDGFDEIVTNAGRKMGLHPYSIDAALSSKNQTTYLYNIRFTYWQSAFFSSRYLGCNQGFSDARLAEDRKISASSPEEALVLNFFPCPGGAILQPTTAASTVIGKLKPHTLINMFQEVDAYQSNKTKKEDFLLGFANLMLQDSDKKPKIKPDQVSKLTANFEKYNLMVAVKNVLQFAKKFYDYAIENPEEFGVLGETEAKNQIIYYLTHFFQKKDKPHLEQKINEFFMSGVEPEIGFSRKDTLKIQALQLANLFSEVIAGNDNYVLGQQPQLAQAVIVKYLCSRYAADMHTFYSQVFGIEKTKQDSIPFQSMRLFYEQLKVSAPEELAQKAEQNPEFANNLINAFVKFEMSALIEVIEPSIITIEDTCFSTCFESSLLSVLLALSHNPQKTDDFEKAKVAENADFPQTYFSSMKEDFKKIIFAKKIGNDEDYSPEIWANILARRDGVRYKRAAKKLEVLSDFRNVAYFLAEIFSIQPLENDDYQDFFTRFFDTLQLSALDSWEIDTSSLNGRIIGELTLNFIDGTNALLGIHDGHSSFKSFRTNAESEESLISKISAAGSDKLTKKLVLAMKKGDIQSAYDNQKINMDDLRQALPYYFGNISINTVLPKPWVVNAEISDEDVRSLGLAMQNLMLFGNSISLLPFNTYPRVNRTLWDSTEGKFHDRYWQTLSAVGLVDLIRKDFLEKMTDEAVEAIMPEQRMIDLTCLNNDQLGTVVPYIELVYDLALDSSALHFFQNLPEALKENILNNINTNAKEISFHVDQPEEITAAMELFNTAHCDFYFYIKENENFPFDNSMQKWLSWFIDHDSKGMKHRVTLILRSHAQREQVESGLKALPKSLYEQKLFDTRINEAGISSAIIFK